MQISESMGDIPIQTTKQNYRKWENGSEVEMWQQNMLIK